MLATGPKKSRLRLVLRYGVVGGAGAAFSFLAYYWLVGSFSDTLGYVWPSVMVALVWFPAAFFLHIRFVFFTPVSVSRAFVKFLSAQWALFFLGPLTLVILVELLGRRPIVAYGVSIAFISFTSFLVSRLLVFRTQSPGSPLR
jgi:putative flippase GtrA